MEAAGQIMVQGEGRDYVEVLSLCLDKLVRAIRRNLDRGRCLLTRKKGSMLSLMSIMQGEFDLNLEGDVGSCEVGREIHENVTPKIKVKKDFMEKNSLLPPVFVDSMRAAGVGPLERSER